MSQFKKPIVFNDLEEMRDSIGYGTRMNRRLHSPPFHKLREFVAHEATFDASKGGEKFGTHDSSVFPTGHSTRSNAGENGSNVVSMGDRITTECGYQYLQKGLENWIERCLTPASPPRLKGPTAGIGMCEPADHDPPYRSKQPC